MCSVPVRTESPCSEMPELFYTVQTHIPTNSMILHTHAGHTSTTVLIFLLHTIAFFCLQFLCTLLMLPNDQDGCKVDPISHLNDLHNFTVRSNLYHSNHHSICRMLLQKSHEILNKLFQYNLTHLEISSISNAHQTHINSD